MVSFMRINLSLLLVDVQMLGTSKMFRFFIFFMVYLLMCQLNHCMGKALFLTPLIEKGEIRAAQKKAEVKPFLPKVKSYSGYLTVDKAYNSNVFFWFFPKASNWTTAPLILWLDGGPGSSSLFSLFCWNGPYSFEKNQLKKRPHSWSNFYNLLYIDVPVGTGFSFSDSYRAYGGNHTEVGGHALEALRQFLLLFPAMQKNKLILCSQCYGGKHVISVAYFLLTKPIKPQIKLWKIFMSSPFISAEDMLPHFSLYFEAHGLLDGQGRDTLHQYEDFMLSHLKAKKCGKAFDLQKHLFGNNSIVHKLTGLENKFSFLTDSYPSMARLQLEEFVNKKEIKAALHARNNHKFVARNFSVTFEQKDYMKSVRGEFGTVLDNFRTLAYFGQVDMAAPYLLHTKVMENVDWSGNWHYTQASRQLFLWNQQLCGYYKTARGYTEVLIRNAGHLVPQDQPQCVLALLQSFINGDLD